MADFDTTELLEDIRARGGLGSSDLRFTSAKLLAAATLELRDAIAPLLVETQTERGVYVSNTSTTAGDGEYRLPLRALGARYSSVAWKATSDTKYTRLRHLGGAEYYLQDANSSGRPEGFYLRDGFIVLVPTPNTAGTLRVPYYLRPSKLVLPSAVEVAIIGTTEYLDIGDSPLVYDFNYDTAYDVVSAEQPFTLLGIGLTTTYTLVGSNYRIYFSGPLLDTVSVGDYLCLAGQSPVPQCPVETRGLLAARAARRALKSVGDGDVAAMLDADVAELEAKARSLLAPRVDKEPQDYTDIRRGLLYGLL